MGKHHFTTMMFATTVALAVLLLSLPLATADDVLVPASVNFDSVPHTFFPLKSRDRALFVLDSAVWSADHNKTTLLQFGYSEVLGFYPLGDDAVYVAQEDSENALELWRTDGSPKGTHKLHGFGTDKRRLPLLTIYQDALYFANGPELWRMDSSFLPYKVHDLRMLIVEQTQESIFTMYVWKDILYMSLGSEHGLFRTDGTEDGLQMIAPGISVNFKEKQPQLDDKLYFVTTTRELWSTDGTKHNTGPVAGSQLENQKVVDLFQHSVNGRIVFGLGDAQYPHLFTTDGTETGTMPLDVQLEEDFVFEKNASNVAAKDLVVEFRDYGETFYFPGRVASSQVIPVGRTAGRVAFTVDGAGPLTTGFSLWTSDGKSAQVLHEFFDTVPYDTMDLEDGRLLVRTNQPDEIWMSDGEFTTRLYASASNSSVYDLEESWTGKYWAMRSDTELLFTGYSRYNKGELLKVTIPPLPSNDVDVLQESSGGIAQASRTMGSIFLAVVGSILGAGVVDWAW